jgi:hypothetical protein
MTYRKSNWIINSLYFFRAPGKIINKIARSWCEIRTTIFYPYFFTTESCEEMICIMHVAFVVVNILREQLNCYFYLLLINQERAKPLFFFKRKLLLPIDSFLLFLVYLTAAVIVTSSFLWNAVIVTCWFDGVTVYAINCYLMRKIWKRFWGPLILSVKHCSRQFLMKRQLISVVFVTFHLHAFSLSLIFYFISTSY